jgi:DNA-3-methyladenine glycosylase
VNHALPERRRSDLRSAALRLSQHDALARWRAPLDAAFYARPVEQVARDLLGCMLLLREGRRVVGGTIVEVEAYLGPHDAASHAVVGRTARTYHLFGAPGTAYVYRIYGMYWCVNAVTDRASSGSAVLVRAVAPRVGIQAMRERTPHATSDDALCRGPGRLCRAFGIDRGQDGTSLVSGPLRIAPRRERAPVDIVTTRRIGITKAAEKPLRFHVDGQAAVSGTRAQNRPIGPDGTTGGENSVRGD